MPICPLWPRSNRHCPAPRRRRRRWRNNPPVALRGHMRPGSTGHPQAGVDVDLHHQVEIAGRELVRLFEIGTGAGKMGQAVDPAKGGETGGDRLACAVLARQIGGAGNRRAACRRYFRGHPLGEALVQIGYRPSRCPQPLAEPLSATTTDAPRAPAASPARRPSPRPAPVTRIACPSKRISSVCAAICLSLPYRRGVGLGGGLEHRRASAVTSGPIPSPPMTANRTGAGTGPGAASVVVRSLAAVVTQVHGLLDGIAGVVAVLARGPVAGIHLVHGGLALGSGLSSGVGAPVVKRRRTPRWGWASAGPTAAAKDQYERPHDTSTVRAAGHLCPRQPSPISVLGREPTRNQPNGPVPDSDR